MSDDLESGSDGDRQRRESERQRRRGHDGPEIPGASAHVSDPGGGSCGGPEDLVEGSQPVRLEVHADDGPYARHRQADGEAAGPDVHQADDDHDVGRVQPPPVAAPAGDNRRQRAQ